MNVIAAAQNDYESQQLYVVLLLSRDYRRNAKKTTYNNNVYFIVFISVYIITSVYHTKRLGRWTCSLQEVV